jgi:hypothetical protein
MKPSTIIRHFLPALALSCCLSILPAQEQTRGGDGNFYEKSLHYTNRGLEYWYLAKNGGLERITGIPFKEMRCNTCHVRNCDTCHVKDVDGKPTYSVETAGTEKACGKCHEMESKTFAVRNPADPTADVHFAKGMKCMDCHSSREIHGDGTLYDSIQAPGAMDITCVRCHADLSRCPSNAVHKGRLDCNACHVRDVPSCYNCHIDTKVSEGKSASIPMRNMLFLINHDNKVTLANLHTFIYQDKTLIVFAPSFSHLVMKQGRKCGDCHATAILRQMKAGAYKPVAWQNGELKTAGGIIPVLDGFRWDFVFLNYEKGQWLPAEKAASPLLNYSGYSSPITKEQFDKLAAPQSPKP